MRIRPEPRRDRTRARTPRAALMLLASLPTLAAGCALFTPTEPEPPQGEVIVADYSDPNRTLDTMEQGIMDKGRTNGLAVYEGSFVPEQSPTGGFRAYHLPEVVQAYQGTVPPNWTIDLERVFYSNLIQVDSDAYDAFWGPDPRFAGLELIDVDADTACFFREYTVRARGPSGIATIAHGFAYLGFARIAGDWLIIRWQDIPGEDGDLPDETMGSLRLNER